MICVLIFVPGAAELSESSLLDLFHELTPNSDSLVHATLSLPESANNISSSPVMAVLATAVGLVLLRFLGRIVTLDGSLASFLLE